MKQKLNNRDAAALVGGAAAALVTYETLIALSQVNGPIDPKDNSIPGHYQGLFAAYAHLYGHVLGVEHLPLVGDYADRLIHGKRVF